MKKILFAALALIVMMVSCVKDPQYPGVTISDLSYNPTAVQDMDEVTVTATITSFDAFTAKLFYVAGDAKEVELPMTANLAEKDVYAAVIPGQPDGTTVKFYVVAEGSLVTTSPSKEYTVGAVAIDYSGLRLNELNGKDKFIEIFNAGNDPVNMKGVYIEKDGKQNWVGSSAVTVEAGGYIVLWGEDKVLDHLDIDTANYIFHSGLSAKKNVRIQIFTPAGESIDDFNLTNIDLNGEAYGYEENQAPASYSRNADGNWYYADATPGAANVDGENIVLGLEGGVTPEPPTPEEPDYTNLILNELNGSKGKKFIEIYNMGDLPLSLEGMYIEKDDKVDPIWVGDATNVIPAHGYIVLYSENVLADHPELEGTNLIFGGGLSSKKTVRIELFMPDQTSRDLFTRGDPSVGWNLDLTTDVDPMSFARTPDGGDWMLALETPGEANPDSGEPIPQE